jgi:hypothetical protein
MRAAGEDTSGWPKRGGRSSGWRDGFDGIFANASGFDGTRLSDGSERYAAVALWQTIPGVERVTACNLVGGDRARQVFCVNGRIFLALHPW